MIEQRKKERKTAFVVIFSLVMMVLEVIVGFFSNSMALLADGIHMGSHVLAIGLSWGAYVLVRRLEHRNNSDMDSTKILSLSAFTSGILLLLFALFIIIEAGERFFTPTMEIKYTEALIVAVIGIVVNAICAVVLHEKKEHSDHNSHSAYIHVLADALTSVGAIIGLVCAMIWDVTWIDTVVALASSLVIIRWAKSLLFETGKELVSNK